MNRYRIPQPIGQLMACLPSWPGSLLFVSALNAILKHRLPEDVRSAIAGKQLRLTITEQGLISISSGRKADSFLDGIMWNLM